MVDVDHPPKFVRKILQGFKVIPLITKSIHAIKHCCTLDIFPLISFTYVSKKKYFYAWNIALVVEF